MAILIGYIDRSIYESTSYSVANVKISARERASIVHAGILPIRKTVEVTMFGDWQKHKKHGRQFHVNRLEKTRRANRLQVN